MKNDANLDGQKISILPTLLFSTIGKIADVRKCLTSDLKAAGDLVYLVGETFDECGGSEYYQELNIKGGLGPRVDLKTAKNRYEKISTATKQGLICSNHDCSDAGFAAAAVEKAIGGKLGLDLDLAPANINHSLKKDRFLFSESQSRFVLTIHPDNQQNFENLMQDTACYLIGIVTLDPTIKIAFGDETVICESVSDLETSWKKTLSHAV